MPGRKYSAGSVYRYGFNGKEKDNEIEGDANAYDYGARIYDSRLGRWFSTDPLQAKHPAQSPYLFTGGNPILFKDPDGMDKIVAVYVKTDFGTYQILQKTTHKGVYEKTITAVYLYGAVKVANYNTVDSYTIDLTKDRPKNSPFIAHSSSTEFVNTYETNAFSYAGKKVGNAFNNAASGNSSFQDYGYVVTGNGNGTMEFKNKAGVILGHIDIGALLALAGMAKDTKGVEGFPEANELLKETDFGKKLVERFLDKLNASGAASEVLEKTVEQTKEQTEESTKPPSYPVYKNGASPKNKLKYPQSSKESADPLKPDTVYYTTPKTPVKTKQ